METCILSSLSQFVIFCIPLYWSLLATFATWVMLLCGSISICISESWYRIWQVILRSLLNVRFYLWSCHRIFISCFWVGLWAVKSSWLQKLNWCLPWVLRPSFEVWSPRFLQIFKSFFYHHLKLRVLALAVDSLVGGDNLFVVVSAPAQFLCWVYQIVSARLRNLNQLFLLGQV